MHQWITSLDEYKHVKIEQWQKCLIKVLKSISYNGAMNCALR